MLLPKSGQNSASAMALQASQIANRNQLADRLVEKYSRTKAGARLNETWKKDKTRARNAAIALDNQVKYLKQFNETTIKTQFNTVPENVLRIVRIGTANRNRGNIFTEWPLVTPDDAIYFVDRVYDSPMAGAVTQSGGALRGGTPGERIYEVVAPDHATEQYSVSGTQAVVASTAATFNITANPTPLVPLHLMVHINGALVGRDNGNGQITFLPGLGSTTGTVNYSTGAVQINLAANHPYPTSTLQIVVTFAWDSEVDTNYKEWGRVDLKVTKKRFNARPQPLGYSYTKLVDMTLSTTGLGNVEEMLVKAVGDEHAMRADFKAVQLAKRIAARNPTKVFDADFATAGEDNDYNHAQRVLATISDVSGEMFNEVGRGVVNRIVAGTRAITYFKKHRLWKSDVSQARVGGTYLAGMLDDIEVYACRSVPGTNLVADNEALLVFKNPDEEGDVSLAFGTMTELVAALDYPEFYRVGNVATVEDQLVINDKFIRRLVLDNLIN